MDAAWTQAVVPELPSGLREDRNTVATNIADLIRQASLGRPLHRDMQRPQTMHFLRRVAHQGFCCLKRCGPMPARMSSLPGSGQVTTL